MKANKTSHKKTPRGLARRIATILLAGAMVFPVALSASACRVTITDNGDGTFSINPANPNEQDNNTSSQGSTNTPQGGQTNPKEPDYSKYSPLLQEVLNDSEYDELYRMLNNGKLRDYPLCAIPYEFLESKGENIADIKNSSQYSGLVGVRSDLYTIKNEPNYIYNKLDVYHSTDGKSVWGNENSYINKYLLQYQITEQELKDLEMLYWGRYFQGPVMFQRLASKQTPKVIEEFSIEEKTYDGLLSCLNNQKSIRDSVGLSSVSSFIVKDLDTEPINDQLNYYLTIDMISDPNNYYPVSNRLFQNSTIKIRYITGADFSNNIFSMNTYNIFKITENSDATPITYYSLYPYYPLTRNFRNFKDLL